MSVFDKPIGLKYQDGSVMYSASQDNEIREENIKG